jgi:D-arabinose 1-dehydrogenase-like Zn-dependent alcohol dehydrogenase
MNQARPSCSPQNAVDQFCKTLASLASWQVAIRDSDRTIQIITGLDVLRAAQAPLDRPVDPCNRVGRHLSSAFWQSAPLNQVILMKAAVIEGAEQPLVIKDVSTPSVGDRDVLIRVHACGVCHTDLHVADGFLSGLGYDPFPLVLGHEIAGTVEEVGSEVSHLNQGDRVGAYWWLGCGRCRCCLSGEEEACGITQGELRAAGLTLDGGYAEFVRLPADYAIALPAELEFSEAAPFLCAGLTMYAALKNSGLRAGQRAAVVGIGGLGHLALQIAKAMGAECIGITSTEAKVELAQRLGAHHVITAASGGVGKQLMDYGGADVVLSTTLDFQTVREVMRGLLPLGTMVLSGLMPGRLPLDPRSFILGQQRVVGVNIGSRQDLHEILRLAALHNIRPMVETYALDEVNSVHQRLRDNQVRFRAVLTPDTA